MRMAQSRAAEFVHRSADAIIYITLIRVFCVIICLNSIEMRGIAQTMPVDQTSLVRNVMDLSADPCVDINQYACGNFSRLYPIPSDKSSYSLDDAVNSHVPHLATVRTIEEQAEAGGDRRPADVRQIGDFYASCISSNGDLGIVSPYWWKPDVIDDEMELTFCLNLRLKAHPG
jgi:Peptidase family M13